MKAGFTGTQKGITKYQKRSIEKLLLDMNVKEFHHGDCIGADAAVHTIAEKFNIIIVIHPPEISTKRAFCKSQIILSTKPFLVRNKHIINSTDILIATPSGYKEILRSGTWSTIRYAKKLGHPVYIIYPNGDIECISKTVQFYLEKGK